MKAAIFLLLALAVSASALCFPGQEYVYARGQAKVKVYSHFEVKDLRVELVSYSDRDRNNVTVLASANVDNPGLYVIAGTARAICHFPRHYGLRLYAGKIATYPVKVGNGVDYDRIEIPSGYVNFGKERVKFFEQNIDGELHIES